jgi:hypothetical protein
MGLLLLDLLHPIEPNTTAATAIRQIGELRIRKKNLDLYCRMSSPAFTRMAYPVEASRAHFHAAAEDRNDCSGHRRRNHQRGHAS